MNRWLNAFVYRTNLHIWIFVASAALAALVALVTVSHQSLKAAVRDPVVSLRYE
jgi:putative ABC transport system permease protein